MTLDLGGWGPSSGIQIGDIIISCRGSAIRTEKDLATALQSAAPGSIFVVNRNGTLKELVVGAGAPGFTTLPVATDELPQAEETWSNIIVTTAHWIEGYRVEKTIDVISAECVFGMNLFKDLFAGITDLIGGRSSTSQETLRKARKICISELKQEAFNIGANAVIGVSLDYSEFSGQGKSMLFLVATGTAVIQKKMGESKDAAILN